MTAGKSTVLFLCTGNSCRSQMAEGLARRLLGDRVDVMSAGVKPKGIDPRAAAVMSEIGIDISGQHSKNVAELVDRGIDLVITVCGDVREQCPVFPGATRVVHVGFDDPPRLAASVATEDAARAAYRRVRDEIRVFVEKKLPGML